MRVFATTCLLASLLLISPAVAEDSSKLVVDTQDTSKIDQRATDSLAALRSELNYRFLALQKATDVFNENLTRVPTLLDKAVADQKELVKSAISTLKELLEKEIQTVSSQSADRYALVNAKLEDREKAANKSEQFMADAINQSKALSQSEIAGLTAAQAALTSRLDKIEGQTSGVGSTFGYLFAAFGAVMLVITFFFREKKASRDT